MRNAFGIKKESILRVILVYAKRYASSMCEHK